MALNNGHTVLVNALYRSHESNVEEFVEYLYNFQ